MDFNFENKHYTRLDVLLKDIEGDELSGELIVNSDYHRPIVFINGEAQLKPGVNLTELIRGNYGLQ